MTTYQTPDLPPSLEEVWDLGDDHWVRVEDNWFVHEAHQDKPRSDWVDYAVQWPELVAEYGPLSDETPSAPVRLHRPPRMPPHTPPLRPDHRRRQPVRTMRREAT